MMLVVAVPVDILCRFIFHYFIVHKGEAQSTMKISKFIFIVGTVIYFVFSSTVSGFCYQDSLTHQEEINVNILEDKLEMDEIENVKNAVE